MRVTIESNERIKREIDIEFPIYRKHRLDNSTIFMKVESLEKQINIHVYPGKKVEFEIEPASTFSSEDYFCGRGFYQSNETEFKMALDCITTMMIHAKTNQ